MDKITDIKPGLHYKTYDFYRITYPNGEGVMDDICQAKKKGILPYTKKKTAHLMLGSDVSALLTGNYNLIRTSEQVALEKLKTLSNDEIIKIISQNNFIKKKHQRQASLIKRQTKKINRLKEEIENIKQLYKKRDELEIKRKTEVFNHIEKHLFNNSAVKAITSELFLTCGVYFLIKENEVVYVGQSVNIAARIIAHKNDGKVFDEVKFILCEKEKLDEKEMFFIKLLQPKLNGDYKNKNHENIFKVIMEIN